MRLMIPQVVMSLPLTGLGAVLLGRATPNYTTSEAGNPFINGWYADPDAAVYNAEYWVYPTSSYPYDQQTYLDAFSSPDLVHWTKHPNILTTASFSWAQRAVWAPSPISRNGKYYLYFAANDIQENDVGLVGGIGVGVADKPEGPYTDPIGKPLIGEYHNGAQPIDQAAFIDTDGQAYIYYGGHGHANVAKLNSDMTSIGTFDDGTQFKEITPTNYVEGVLMVKRGSIYYLFWSEGGWGGPDYAVSYAMSSSPLGPFNRVAKILQQDSAIATSSGHNGVINVPGTDIYYIVYHRRPLSETDINHRVVCYDRMYFDADGTIQPVKMQVKDNFEDGGMIAWKTYGGSFSVGNGQLSVGSSLGGKALLDTNFGDLVFDADITITSGTGDAGLVFRATNPSTGVDSYNGYYAGIKTSGVVVLGVANGSWRQLASSSATITVGTQYHMRIRAVGSTIQVFVGDMNTPKITVTDSTYSSGQDGVRVYLANASYDNVSVAKP